jgi:hypothetical protein
MGLLYLYLIMFGKECSCAVPTQNVTKLSGHLSKGNVRVLPEPQGTGLYIALIKRLAKDGAVIEIRYL